MTGSKRGTGRRQQELPVHKDQIKQSICRLLDQADERKLENIYCFVLHIIK